jgi:hypothetical protein
MLWSRPVRAHAPIVDVVKCTFAAARMDCASARVIQSVAAGIGQSLLVPPGPVDGAGSAGLDSVDAPSAAVVALSPPPASSVEADARDRAAARRSFFAQPVPLKWTAGAANAFFTGPLPQSGHADGPSAWTPWMTSNRRPHAAQS